MNSSYLILQEILEKLNGVEEISESSYKALCPCHHDRNNPNLHITVNDEVILMYCFACGANGGRVMEAIGMPIRLLFLSRKRGDRQWR